MVKWKVVKYFNSFNEAVEYKKKLKRVKEDLTVKIKRYAGNKYGIRVLDK